MKFATLRLFKAREYVMSESASSGLGSSQGPHQVTWAKIESDSPFGVRSRFQLVADGEGHVVAIGKILLITLN